MYTQQQIDNARRSYNSFMIKRNLADYDVDTIGYNEAVTRMDDHNNLVDAIAAGNIDLERKWKTFFLHEEVKRDQKLAASKTKLAANKEASSDVLSQVKAAGKKLGDYYSFVKSNKQFAREFFSKKFTQQSVSAFLAI